MRGLRDSEDDLILGEMACLTAQRRTRSLRVASDEAVIYEVTRNVLDMLLRHRAGAAQSCCPSTASAPPRSASGRASCIATAARRRSRDRPEQAQRRETPCCALHARLAPGAGPRRPKQGNAVLLSYQPDQRIISQGDPFDGFYILRLGHVQVSRWADGREVILDLYGGANDPSPRNPRRALRRNRPAVELSARLRPTPCAAPGRQADGHGRRPGSRRGPLGLFDGRRSVSGRTGRDEALDPRRKRSHPKGRECRHGRGGRAAATALRNRGATGAARSAAADQERQSAVTDRPAFVGGEQCAGGAAPPVQPGQRRPPDGLRSPGTVPGSEVARPRPGTLHALRRMHAHCADSHHRRDGKEERPQGSSRLFREGPRFDRFLVATCCRSCVKPYCLDGCPVDAIHRKGHNLEVAIDNWCIGCGLCERNCPYGAIQMVPLEGDRGGARTAAVQQMAVNCDLCHGLVAPGSKPFCVRACPHEAAFRFSGEELLEQVLPKR